MSLLGQLIYFRRDPLEVIFKFLRTLNRRLLRAFQLSELNLCTMSRLKAEIERQSHQRNREGRLDQRGATTPVSCKLRASVFGLIVFHNAPVGDWVVDRRRNQSP